MSTTVSNIIVGLNTTSFITLSLYGVAEGSGIDLGGTEGGVEIATEREYFHKTSDLTLGNLSANKFVENCIVKFSLVESSLANMRLALDLAPAALAGTTLDVGGRAESNELTMYVNVNAVGGGTRKYTFHKCVVTSPGTHSYTKDGQTMIEYEVMVLQDTAQSANKQLYSVVDASTDTTAPTVAMTSPTDGGTVASGSSEVVTLTITDAGVMNESTIRYGDTIIINNVTTPASAVLVAGTITYDATTKVISFTPDSSWNASDDFQLTVSTGLKDMAGNRLAAPFIGQFAVTA